MSQMQIQLQSNIIVDVYNDCFIVKDRLIPSRSSVFIYACVDNVKCYLGEVDTPEQLYELVGPNKLMSTIEDVANDYELDSFMEALKESDYVYTINQKKYKIEF